MGFTVVARDLKFRPAAWAAPAGSSVTVTLDNQETGVIHDIVFFNPDAVRIGGTELLTGPATATVTFSVGAPGRYTFKCSVHPQDMLGLLTVS